MEEKNVIEEYFKALQEYYLSSNVLAVIEKVLLENLEQKHEKIKSGKRYICKYGRKNMAIFGRGYNVIANFSI